MRFSSKHLILFLIVVFLSACSSPVTPETPDVGSDWELVWQDEFDGSRLDAENWTVEIGAGGWGNNEWQFYTDRPENVRVENGHLIIEAHQEDYQGSDYTSARLKTQGLHAWTYGRFEARMKLPTGQGIWSAFWLLGEDFPTDGWPQCGEIDVMENIGEPDTIHGTVHGPGYSGGNGIGDSFTVDGESLHDEFHTYAIEWQPDEIHWYIDGSLFNRVSAGQVPGAWVYDHPFFLILNLAVGGNWPGYPDETTEFPQKLYVDYVRVYQNPDATPVPTAQVEQMNIASMEAETIIEADQWYAQVWVAVADQHDRPVEGVQVEAGWVGIDNNTLTTDAQGVAGPFESPKTEKDWEVTLCVIDLIKEQYRYQKADNAETCAFMEAP